MHNITKSGKYKLTKFADFAYICIVCGNYVPPWTAAQTTNLKLQDLFTLLWLTVHSIETFYTKSGVQVSKFVVNVCTKLTSNAIWSLPFPVCRKHQSLSLVWTIVRNNFRTQCTVYKTSELFKVRPSQFKTLPQKTLHFY